MALTEQIYRKKEVVPDQDCTAVIESLRQKVLERSRRENRDFLKEPIKYQQELMSLALLEAESFPVKPPLDHVQSVVSDILGLGPLQDILTNSQATEIFIPRHDLIYAEYDGRLVEESIRFRSEEHFLATLQKMAMVVRRPLDDRHPVIDAKLPDGSRVNMVISPISVWGCSAQIRRFPKHYPMNELVASGTISLELYQLIVEAIKSGLHIIFTGEMSGGKTTLLNAFIELIGEVSGSQTRVVIYEDIAELKPDRSKIKHVVQYESRMPNLEGHGEVSIKYLSQTQMLRSTADWIVMGEIRGMEAYYVVSAMVTGHKATTCLHAPNAIDAVLTRLPDLFMMSEEGRAQGWQGALRKVAAGVDLVIHSAKVRKGDRVERKAVQVAQVTEKRLGTGETIPDVKLLFGRKNDKLIQLAEPTVLRKRGWWVH